MRPLCICNQRPAAINYIKEGKTYYRKKCETCLRHGIIGYGIPRWVMSGYEKREYCEKCKFKSAHQEQFNVYHIDGDLQNCRPSNLKTVCANCQRIIQKEGYTWRQGDLTPDF